MSEMRILDETLVKGRVNSQDRKRCELKAESTHEIVKDVS